MTERSMATIRRIDSIDPIEGADTIEVATVGGWKVVVKKGDFQVNSLAVYLEIDSWVPNELASFLTSVGKEPREYNGVKGERLRTVKLRGQVSQGLLLSLEPTCKNIASELFEGLDVTFPLNIQKWERPIPAQLAGKVKGNFPSLIPKTDQERIQNLTKQFEKLQEHRWEVTEKLDGSSCTFYLDNEGEFHVCSRNLDLERDENNSFWKVAIKYDIENKLRLNKCKGLALQGELVGEGIQGNQYKTELDFYVFDVYNVNIQQYTLPASRQSACKLLGLKHVPILEMEFDISKMNVQDLLKMAEGKSFLNGSEREGIVFKSTTDHQTSFKAISNKWLLKGGD